jgi:hypothetical protein
LRDQQIQATTTAVYNPAIAARIIAASYALIAELFGGLAHRTSGSIRARCRSRLVPDPPVVAVGTSVGPRHTRCDPVY